METLETILAETTKTFRKGPWRTEREIGDLKVIEYNGYPLVTDADESWKQIDVHFVVVAVDVNRAEAKRADLIAWLRSYPEPERLAGGPSYIEVGAVIGSQDMALSLFALGQALNLWQVVTPALLGITGPEADMLAGNGMVLITGWTDK